MLALLLAACTDQALTRFNAAPTATILAPAPGDELPEGAAVSLRGTVADPDDAAADLRVAWFLDGQAVCPDAVADVDGTVTCTAPAPEPGPTVVRLEVVDPEGEAATATVDFGVLTDDPPTVELLGPDASERLYAGEGVSLVAWVADDEDAAEDLQVWFELDGQPLGDPVPGPSATLTLEAAEAAELVVEAHVLDTADQEAVDALRLTVGPENRAPSCEVVAPTEGAVLGVGEVVGLVGAVDDADEGPLALDVVWESDVDGELGTALPDAVGSVSLDAGPLTAGVHTLLLRATDERGLACEDRVEVAVGSAPAVEIEAPADGAVVAEGAAIALVARVADAEDAPTSLTVAWTSDRDGALGGGAADATGLATASATPSVGAHTLTATVTDPLGFTASVAVVVVVDGTPGAPGLTLTPAAPEPGDALTCTVSTAAVDPEGAALTYTFAWQVDGVAYGGAADTATASEVPGADVAAGQTWVCSATAHDGTSAGPAGTASVHVADDLDGDGWIAADDCDDGDPTVNPGEAELCGDGVDNDCDPTTGDGGTAEVCNGLDDDCDGAVDDVSGVISSQADADALVDCTELSELTVHAASGVLDVDLPLLTRVDGPVYFHAAPDVVRVSLPALAEVTGYVYLYHNPALEELDLGALTTVGDYLYVDGNTALDTVDLGAVTRIDGYLYLSGNTAWCTPAAALSAATVGTVYVGGNLCN